MGNRTSLTTDLGKTTYSYDKANRLLSAGTTQYSYDAAGNQITQVGPSGEVDYSYNAAGKLTKVALPDGTGVTYAYDALGRKVERTESGWALRGGGPGAGHGGQGDGVDPSSAGDQGNGKDNGLGNWGAHVQGNDNGNHGSTAASASVAAWEQASAEHARQASGVVRAVIGESLRPNSIWLTQELPALTSNPMVTEIIQIDPKTLQETTISRR